MHRFKFGSDQLASYALMLARPTIISDPFKKRFAVDVIAMGMHATIGAIQRSVTTLDLTVGMRCIVRANYAHPAFRIRARQDKTLLVKPCHYIINAIVFYFNGSIGSSVSLKRRNATCVTYLL